MPRFDLEQFLQLIAAVLGDVRHIVPPIVLALAKHPLVDKYDLRQRVDAVLGRRATRRARRRGRQRPRLRSSRATE